MFLKPLDAQLSQVGDGQAPARASSIWRDAILPYLATRFSLVLVGLLADFYILPLLSHYSVLASLPANTHFPGLFWLMWQRFGANLHAHLRGEELRHPRFEVRPLTAILHQRGVQHELAPRLDLGGHVGELELDRLVLRDGLAEGAALLRVTYGILEGGLRHTDGAGGDIDASDLQAAHGMLKALAFLAAQQA